jgi:hypothetical protein
MLPRIGQLTGIETVADEDVAVEDAGRKRDPHRRGDQ